MYMWLCADEKIIFNKITAFQARLNEVQEELLHYPWGQC